MTSPIMLRDDAGLSVSFLPSAHEMRESALAAAALIGKVTTPEENAAAVEAQKAIKLILKITEDSRKAIKEPVLDYGRRIDSAAKDFTAELKAEDLRLMRLAGDFQQLQEAKQRAAEAAKVRELDELERRKQEEIANAQSHDEIDEIQARYNEEAAALPVVKSEKVAGQVVKPDWEIEVSDVWALARAHPACVRIEPRISEIKALLNNGVKVVGVNAKPIVKSTVRVGRESLALV